MKRLIGLMVLGVGFACLAQDRGSPKLEARRGVVATGAEGALMDQSQTGMMLSKLSLIVEENGDLEIAGIVGFSVNAAGKMVVLAKPDGDFEADAVLRLPSPVWRIENGAIAVDHVREIGGNIEFALKRDSIGGVAAAGCEGVQLPNGTFTCIKQTCSGVCKVHINEQNVKYCDCGPTPPAE